MSVIVVVYSIVIIGVQITRNTGKDNMLLQILMQIVPQPLERTTLFGLSPSAAVVIAAALLVVVVLGIIALAKNPNPGYRDPKDNK